RAVGACGCHGLAVGTEGDGLDQARPATRLAVRPEGRVFIPDRIRMPDRPARGLCGPRIPERCGSVGARGQDLPAVRAARHRHDLGTMPHGDTQGSPGGNLPQPGRPVVTPRQSGRPVPAEGHADDLALMLEGRLEELAADYIPKASFPVGAP